MQSNKKVILHIGRHKSGTSSLQKFLCENSQALHDCGYYYPKSLRSSIAHHPLAYYYSHKNKQLLGEKDFDEIKKFWNEIEKHNVIISSEAFQHADPNLMIEDFAKYDLKIVVYLRDQASYLLSAYSQSIKSQKMTMTLDEFEKNLFKSANYFDFLQKWRNAFPNAELIINIFDKEYLIDKDIRKDFLIKTGLCGMNDFESFFFPENDQNPSIGGNLLEFKRILNGLNYDDFINKRKFYQVLQKIASENKKYKLKTIMSEVMYKRICKKYEHSNKKVSDIYLNGKKIQMKEPESFSNQFTYNIQDIYEILHEIYEVNPEISSILENVLVKNNILTTALK